MTNAKLTLPHMILSINVTTVSHDFLKYFVFRLIMQPRRWFDYKIQRNMNGNLQLDQCHKIGHRFFKILFSKNKKKLKHFFLKKVRSTVFSQDKFLFTTNNPVHVKCMGKKQLLVIMRLTIAMVNLQGCIDFSTQNSWNSLTSNPCWHWVSGGLLKFQTPSTFS